MGLNPRWLHRATLVAVGLVVACAIDPAAETAGPRGGPAAQDPARSDERERMVARQIRARGVRDPRVLEAMQTVLRHRFVPDQLQDEAYADTPLPIGADQTISQPYVVAYMTQALQMPAEAKVLEIGTGSGYQAAVLAEIARAVYTTVRSRSCRSSPNARDESSNNWATTMCTRGLKTATAGGRRRRRSMPSS